MARNEYKGERVMVTLPPEIKKLLEKDAKNNGIPIATRATQIITTVLRGGQALHTDTFTQSNYQEETRETNDVKGQESSDVKVPKKFKI